jgi:hypothetical protein
VSELSDLTNAGYAGAIPGYTLHRLNNKAIGEVEDHLQRWHVERAGVGTYALARDLRKEVMAQAIADAAWAYVYDTAAFRRKLQSAEGVTLTIRASIGMTAANLDLDDIDAKVNAVPPGRLREIVDWCWHRDAGGAPGKGGGPPAGTTGGQ